MTTCNRERPMNDLNRFCRTICIVVALAAVAACSLPGSSRNTAKQLYVLQGREISSPVSIPVVQPCLALRVNTPGSSAGLNTARMAYSTEPNQLDYFAYHEWVAPPAKMIAAMIETRLETSALFGLVISGSPDIRTDLRLDSELQVLQQDFAGNSSTVKFAMRVNLVDVASRTLIGSKTFSYRESTEDENAESGVAAANRVADRFLDELVTFVRASTANLECPKQ